MRIAFTRLAFWLGLARQQMTASATMWTTDVDVFKELEKDKGMRARFEQAARLELEGRMGGSGGDAQKDGEKRLSKQEQAEREGGGEGDVEE